jgi:hypothetical protein
MNSTEYPSLNEDLVDAECWATGYGDGSGANTQRHHLLSLGVATFLATNILRALHRQDTGFE